MNVHVNFARRLGSLEYAGNRAWQFMDRYNDVHCHSERALLRPCTVNHGTARKVRSQCQRIGEKAHARNKERLRRGKPRVAKPLRQASRNGPRCLRTAS